jgi:hypothetical protein
VNRANLKFTNLSTTTSRVSVRNNKRARERGGKTNRKQIKSETREFVLPRFGSCKPTPRWGGHKDRVSFNPFPLSNSHLNRVSFLLNQPGHLDPTRTTTNLVSLALITIALRIRMGGRKRDCKSQATRATNNTRIIFSLKSLITNDLFSQLWNLERLEGLIVSWNGLLALVLNVEGWNAWVRWMEVVGLYL